MKRVSALLLTLLLLISMIPWAGAAGTQSDAMAFAQKYLLAQSELHPTTPSTDHSREYTPWLIAGPAARSGVNLGTLPTFADVSATVLDAFGLPPLAGTSRAAALFR